MGNVEVQSDSLTEAIAAELRAEKGRRKISQTKIAEAIGRGQSYVSVRLNGDAPLTIDEFVIVSQVLGVKPHDLLRTVLSKYQGLVTDDGHVELVRIEPAVTPSRQDDYAPAADDDYADGEDEGTHDSA